jgi:hypothetical protein
VIDQKGNETKRLCTVGKCAKKENKGIQARPQHHLNAVEATTRSKERSAVKTPPKKKNRKAPPNPFL